MNAFKREEAESLWNGVVKGRLTHPHPPTISSVGVVHMAIGMSDFVILLPWWGEDQQTTCVRVCNGNTLNVVQGVGSSPHMRRTF